MALKVARVPAYGVKVTNSLRGKVVGRAFLWSCPDFVEGARLSH